MTRRKLGLSTLTGPGNSVLRPGEQASTEAQLNENLVRIRILTHNIRYATEAPFKGEERWPIRCPRLCAELAFNSISDPATFICLQEVLHSQVRDILSGLNAAMTFDGEWAYIGVGRDDGKGAGEYSPIFYRPSVWHLRQFETIWLSPTPRLPSKGWDAACIRIVTIGEFVHHKTNQKVLVMNTHLDHQGVQSRQESVKIILQIIDRRSELSGASASILAGDFNSTPDDKAYQIMTGPDSCMEDVGEKVPKERRYGNEMTFTSFGYVDTTPSRIDFIFTRKGSKLNYGTYAVLANRFDDGVYLSDHRACVADLQLLPC